MVTALLLQKPSRVAGIVEQWSGALMSTFLDCIEEGSKPLVYARLRVSVLEESAAKDLLKPFKLLRIVGFKSLLDEQSKGNHCDRSSRRHAILLLSISIPRLLGGGILAGFRLSRLRRGLRRMHEFWLDLPVVVAIRLPPGFPIDMAESGMDDLAGALERRSPRGNRSRSTNVLKVVSSNSHKRKDDGSALRSEVGLALKTDRRVVMLIEDGAVLPDDVSALTDAIIAVEPPTDGHRRAVLQRMQIDPLPEIMSGLASLPLEAIGTVLRRGTTRRQLSRRLLESRAAHDLAAQAKRPDPPPTLHTLPGMGMAGEWGLALATDLRDWSAGRIPWSDVDRGILLHGKPGTGKTTFARALAHSCGVPLVAGSVSRWQSTGHLGDLLGAMRNAFQTAIAKTPAILFIDELDAIGDRAQFSGDNKHYQIQVVNGLLECLDGADGREGVVVVGACNDPSGIDPAIKRSGRLDRSVEIPLPDAVARDAILRLHLGPDLRSSHLGSLARRTEGWAGADLERIVREARRRARASRRDLQLADLEACLPELRPLSGPDLWRASVHEAGHAVVAVICAIVDISAVHVEREIAAPSAGVSAPGGAVVYSSKAGPFLSEREAEAQLALWLAGTAAEAEIIGDRSSGASGGPGSDLHRATLLATCMEAHWGLGPAPLRLSDAGEKPLMKLLTGNATIRSRVEARLAERFEAAKSIVRQNEAAVRTIAKALAEKGALTGREVRDIVAGEGRGADIRATAAMAD